MLTNVRKWSAILGLVAALLVPASAGAGDTAYTNLGNILDAASDTTSAWDAFRYNGAGFIVTWTDEDSISVKIQSSLDGVVWFTMKTIAIDGGTTGPFNAFRAVEATDSAASANAITNGGGFANLPIGYKARAIVTAAGSDTAQAVKFLFVFPS